MPSLKNNVDLGGIISNKDEQIFRRRTNKTTFDDGNPLSPGVGTANIDSVEKTNYYPLVSNNNENPATIYDSMSFFNSVDYFRRSLNNNENSTGFEDPTYLGFQLIFIKSSSLFSSNQNSASYFLNSYSNITNLSQRKAILTRFINTFSTFFRFDTTEGNTTKPKIYYISNLEGLDKLNEKIVDYKGYESENKLTITMNEDIMMSALYLAELYNNLVYDYKNQRYAIPENCIRFDMKVRITEIRDFRVPTASGVTMNQNVSSQYYILRDCNFDFTKAQNHPANLSMGGYGKTLDSNPAEIKFFITYKSIERDFSPLLMNVENGSKKVVNDIYNKETALNIGNKTTSAHVTQGTNSDNNPNFVLKTSTPEMMTNNLTPDGYVNNGYKTTYTDSEKRQDEKSINPNITYDTASTTQTNKISANLHGKFRDSINNIEKSVNPKIPTLGFSLNDPNLVKDYATNLLDYAVNRGKQLANTMILNISDKALTNLINGGPAPEQIVLTDMDNYNVNSTTSWKYVEPDLLGKNKTILQGYAETAKNDVLLGGLNKLNSLGL